MADFPSHPPATLLRTTPQASKPASIRALVTFYQIASSLRKWKSGFEYLSVFLTALRLFLDSGSDIGVPEKFAGESIVGFPDPAASGSYNRSRACRSDRWVRARLQRLSTGGSGS